VDTVTTLPWGGLIGKKMEVSSPPEENRSMAKARTGGYPFGKDFERSESWGD